MNKMLAIILLAVSVGWGVITFTDIPDSTVFQFPHAGQTPGIFPVITGTYTGSPAEISAMILDYDVDTVIKSWTVINALPTGGTFSDTLKEIPRGGPYRLCVKTDLPNDTLRGTHKWGVGEVVGAFGQSNLCYRETGGEPNITFGFAVQYNSDYPHLLIDDWQWSGQTSPYKTSLFPSLANTILSDISNAYPVAFCGYALGGTSMVSHGGGVWYWSDRNASDPDDLTTLYGHFLSQIINQKPNTIIMYQGESDVDKSSAQYTAAVESMFSGLATDLGYTPNICIVQIRSGADSTVADTGWWNIAKAQQDLDDASTILLSACTYDLPTYDGTHLNANSQNICGRRLGHTISKLFSGTLSDGYRFYVDSAYVIERGKVRLLTNHISGNTIIPGSININRMSYRSDALPSILTVSAVSVGDTAISVEVGDHFMTSQGYFEYDRYRTTSNPSENVIYDSDSLPLEPSR